MKTKFTLLAFFAIAFFNGFAQQAPNSGFENWVDAVTPWRWTSLENLLHTTTNIFTYKDTIDFYYGRASVKLVSDSIPNVPAAGVVSSELSLGSGATVGNRAYYTGVPFAYRPDSLIFEYKYSSPGTDTGEVSITLTKNHVPLLNFSVFLQKQNAWTYVGIPLTLRYDSAASVIPDTLLIQFKSSNKIPVKGSTLHVDSLHFFYAPIPIVFNATVTPSGPITFCNGDSVVLQANTGTGYTYQWRQNGNVILNGTNSSYVARSAGTYNVTIDSAGIMAVSQTITVTVNPGPTASLSGLNDTVCRSGATIALTGGSPAGGTYSGPGVTGSNFVPHSASLGVNTITYTVDSANCTGSATASITVVAAAVSLTGLNDSVCNTASAITLSGGTPAGGTYSGSGVIVSTFTPQNAAVGIDTIVYTATDANQCTGSASATITVLHAVVSLTGLNDTLCSNGAAIQLNGGSPAGGTYSGNGVSASTFTPASATLGANTVVYTATDANHCTGSASATVYVEVCGGVDNIAAAEVSVYPNPVTTLLNVTSTENMTGYIIGIYDLEGRLVASHILEGYSNAVNVAKLANGAYIYRITGAENGIIGQGNLAVVK